jgi:hypothetical protein
VELGDRGIEIELSGKLVHGLAGWVGQPADASRA